MITLYVWNFSDFDHHCVHNRDSCSTLTYLGKGASCLKCSTLKLLNKDRNKYGGNDKANVIKC